MNHQRRRRESGQVLVTVALAMGALILFLALAVDVGQIYEERRQMQNAADAGALAGARELCFGSGDPIIAEYVAQDYAERNGAQAVDVTIVDYTVNVVASEDANTIFAGIIGMHTVDIGAEAEAVCGGARSACGLWPIALEQERWDDLVDQCGREFYVWSGDNPNQQPNCTIYDCDVDHIEDQPVPNDIVDMLQRAWLDFSDVMVAEYPDDCVAPGCGTDELVCWILNDSGAQLNIGDCVAGDTGVKAGVAKPVNSREGDLVAIPTFENMVCMGATCPGTSIEVSGWACVRVVAWQQHLELPRLDGALPPWKGPVIKVTVACEQCVTFCGAAVPGPPPPGGIWAVSLTK